MAGNPTHFAPVLYVHVPAEGVRHGRVIEFYIRDLYLVTEREGELYTTRDEAYEAATAAREHHTAMLDVPGHVQAAIKPVWAEVS